MNIIEKMATANKCYQTEGNFTPKGIVLHSIGCAQPSAERMASAYNQYKPNGASVCVHAFLEPNKVVQIMPWTRKAWHVGGDANYTHIGVEMCEPSQIKYTGGATFTCSNYKAAQDYVIGCYNTAVELFATLCIKYNLDPVKDGIIISHSEAYKRGLGSNHADPEHLWKGLNLPYTMDTFRKAVKAKINEMEDDEMAVERYQKLEDIPAGVYRNSVKTLMDKGIIKGDSKGNLDLTKDMIRTMIFCMRIMGM